LKGDWFADIQKWILASHYPHYSWNRSESSEKENKKWFK